MSNKIQIKRSVANSIVTGLSNGELAFTQAGNTFYIGLPDGSGVLRIGGAMVPGTLTANQALVANSSSGIDNVIVANLTPTQIYANSSVGTYGQVLLSGGSGNVYWGTGTSGANTYVQFNDSGVANAVAGFTFDKDANTLTVSNTINAGAGAFTANSTAISINSNLVINSTASIVANGSSGSDQLLAANSSGGNYWIDQGAISINVNSEYTWTNIHTFSANVTFGNSTVNTYIVGGTINLNGGSINSTSYTGSANNADYLGGTAAASYVQNTDSRVLSGNLEFTGANLVVNGGILTVQSNSIINGTNVYVTSNSVFNGANLSVTGANLYITSNVTISATNANVSSNVTFSGNSFNVTGNAVSITANTVDINGKLMNVSSNVVISGANIDASSSFLRIQNAIVGGNLTINGTLTTVNTNNLVVRDNMIQMSANNVSSDTLDSGFYVTANTDGTTRYSGLARFWGDSTATNPVFRLFTTATEPTTTIADSSLGTLKAYIDSVGLISNGTSVAITANSTVNVNIVANTLSLSSALAATSGGTGHGSYTTGDLLVANTGNVLSVLPLDSTAGRVLQSNGTALVYDILDGGTF